MQSVFQETNLENNMAQERMTRRIRQLEEEKLFAEMQASKELDKRRKTPEQKGATSTTVLEEENTALKEQVRELKEQVQLLMTSSQERGAASLAETRGEKTMSTLSTEEASWIENQVRHSTAGSSWDLLTEQTRMTLAEVGAHTGARMCNTMQELSGTKNAIKLGGTGNHLSDTTLRRQLAKTLEQERPRHLWFSLRCGS